MHDEKVNEDVIIEMFSKQRGVEIGGLNISFQRTCRVPYDKVNDLPAGMGQFPIYKVADFGKTAPKEWNSKDYFMPMYQCEAMWMNFRSTNREPRAAIIGSGGINAVTGKQIESYKLEEKQNYLTVPPQPWIDGWKDADGKVYQFVAADLGSGETVEGQITGKETVGGIQISVFKSEKDIIPESRPKEFIVAGDWPSQQWLSCYGGIQTLGATRSANFLDSRNYAMASVKSMGLGRGGQIKQKIYDDPYGLKVWKPEPEETRTVHIVNSQDFKTVTGHNPPSTPISYKLYQMNGYPWFDIWDKEMKDTFGSKVFSKLKPVKEN